MKDNIENRLGERRIMKCGEEAEIVEYKGVRNIVVKFLKTDELVRCNYKQFKERAIKSHFTSTVYGMGIVGLEKTKENRKLLKSYKTWHGMLRRCYDLKLQERYPTYKDCSVCNEWLYYKNFKEWYKENYYEIESQKMALDKDILVKGNKVYSPNNCIFVPQGINSLFIKRQNDRGEYPIGVSWHKKSDKFEAKCSIFDLKTNKNLGLYNTPKEAFNIYKKTKEKNIKEVADYYKNKIPERLYEAMYNYKVEIDD